MSVSIMLVTTIALFLRTRLGVYFIKRRAQA
jgi:hypothetical protein